MRLRSFLPVLAALPVCVIVFLLFYHPEEKTDSKQTHSSVRITGVCARNDTVAFDEEGRYGADFIELTNVTDGAVDVGGWGLSDDPAQSGKYLLPEGTRILAGETLTVWCGPDADWIYRADYVPKDYHQEIFHLREKETVVLTDAEGTVIDTADCTAVTEDPEGKSETLRVPALSVSSGMYEAPFFLEMSAYEGMIFYTTDGSDPDETSTLYTEPLLIRDRSEEPDEISRIADVSIVNPYVPETPVHKGTVVKARVIVPDTGEMSPVVSAVYFVGMDEWEGYGDLPVMSLTIDPKDLFDDTHGIYVTGDVYRNYLARTDADHMWEPYVLPANFTREGRGWERPVIMDYFSPSHEHLLTQSAGIRIHGGWSTAFNQKSFNLYAREEYDGSAVFRYPFFGRTYSKLMLRNGGVRDIYATKLRDVFLQSLMSDRACDIQEGEPCIVFINGEYWGLYNLQEPVGDRYIETRYGIPREDVIFLKTEESNTGLPQDMEMYDDLVAYAALHDMADEEAYAYIANRIDIDSYIDYFCFLIYVADCDSVGNNFARWRARTASGGIADGRWRYVLYDTDDSAGIQSLLTRYHVDSFAAGMHGVSPMDDPLFAALLRNDAYKEKFVTTFMDLANYNFSYDIVHEKLAETATVYKDQVVLSQQRFRGYFTMDDVVEGLPYTGNYTPEHFDADVAIIDEFFANRKEYIVSHMIQNLRLASGPVTITLRAHAQADIVLNTLTLSATGQDWQGEYFPQYPVTLTCIPREGAAFDHWEVNGVAVSYEETFETRVSADMVIRCVIK